MRRVLTLVALLAFTLVLGGAPGEAPGRFSFKTYGPEQGFQDLSLKSIAQDEAGFIWIGCDTGLIRYDGASFTKFTVRDGLPSATIRRLLPRLGGGVWIVAENGLCAYDRGAFFSVDLDGQPFRPVRGAALDQDARGHLWAIGPGGLYRQEGRAMVRVDDLPRGGGRALACRTSSGSVFVEAQGEVWERPPAGGWTRLALAPGLAPDEVESLAVDGTGRLWIVGRRTLRRLDPGAGLVQDASDRLPGTPFANTSASRDGSGGLVIPTNTGILRVKGDRSERIGPREGLPFQWTISSLVDREGNLWVVGPGLCRALGRGWTRAFTVQDGLPSDLVWAVLRDRSGRLFVGTSQGLARLGPTGWTPVRGTEGRNVVSLAEDRAGRLYIGSNNAPLLTLEPGASTASEAFLGSLRWEGGHRPDRSLRVMAGSEGVWLADPALGILLIDPERRTLRVAYGPQDAGASDLPAYHFAEDGRKRLWIATGAGLLVKDGPTWRLFNRHHGLRADALNELGVAPDGSAWLLYREPVGLDRVELKADGSLAFLGGLDTKRGLGTEGVFALALDRQGTLWLGTDRGVEAHGAHGDVVRLGRDGGLVGDDCSQGGLYVDANQDVWVGTTMGLGRVLAGRRPPPLPPLAVTLLRVVRGKGVDALRDPRPIPSREATLEFQFAAQTYINEKAVVYQVRLVGLDDDWRSIQVPQDRYVALPGGTYRYEVRAAYPGMAFGPVTAFTFQVLPPWWKSWWFTTLALLGGLGLVAWIVDRRYKGLAQQKERLAVLVDQATADLVKANHALEEANLALQAQSLSDPLTGLHNRRYLSVVVDDDVAKVQRAYREPDKAGPLPNADLVFFVVDLDHFKEINDRHGHRAGDLALASVARALRRAARDSDAVVRWGGEEFLVMARNASRAEAPQMAERIRAAVAEQGVPLESGETLRWTCSIGYAAYPFNPADPAWLGWERVVEIADACLYMAKRAGRDAWAGASALPGLDRAQHGPRLPWELAGLAEEGVVRLDASGERGR